MGIGLIARVGRRDSEPLARRALDGWLQALSEAHSVPGRAFSNRRCGSNTDRLRLSRSSGAVSLRYRDRPGAA